MDTTATTFSGRLLRRGVLGMGFGLVVLRSQAAPLEAMGPSLTLGKNTLIGDRVNALHNPASGALMRATYTGQRGVLGAVKLSTGAAYGEIDDLFALIDDLAQRIGRDDSRNGAEPPAGGDSAGGQASADYSNWLPPDFDINNPETHQAAIERLSAQVSAGAALIDFVGTEGYGRVNAGLGLPLLINHDIWGGTMALRLSGYVQGGAIGITDPVNFDEQQATTALEALRELSPSAPATTFDLSAGLMLTVGPTTQAVTVDWDNDSALLSKSARTYELAASYSRALSASDSSQWFIGVTPRLLQIGMSNAATRIGDVTDAEQLFNDIVSGERQYRFGATADIGALWVSEQLRAGVIVKNLYPSEFEYPELDLATIAREQVVNQLTRSRQYSLDTQGRIEGSWSSTSSQWQIDTALDTNATADAMGDLHQWWSLSLQYRPNISWLPAIRAGHHRNLKGMPLNYGALGATLFNAVELDIGFTLDTVTMQNNDLPRGFNINVGFNYAI